MSHLGNLRLRELRPMHVEALQREAARPAAGRRRRRSAARPSLRQDSERATWGTAYGDHGLVFAALEDGTRVRLARPTLVVPVSQFPADEEPAEELPEPQRGVLFDPSAWGQVIPAWVSGQVAWQCRHTKKLPSSG